MELLVQLIEQQYGVDVQLFLTFSIGETVCPFVKS